MSKGVSVSFCDDNTASIALHIVVDYGVNLSTLGQSIISQVKYKVTQATGVTVSNVDVYFDSMIVD